VTPNEILYRSTSDCTQFRVGGCHAAQKLHNRPGTLDLILLKLRQEQQGPQILSSLSSLVTQPRLRTKKEIIIEIQRNSRLTSVSEG
jgi:hypothetical protein